MRISCTHTHTLAFAVYNPVCEKPAMLVIYCVLCCGLALSQHKRSHNLAAIA